MIGMFALALTHSFGFVFFLHQDSEQIKKLSPAEQKRKIVEILKKIDTNGDNVLSAGKPAL